MSPPVWNAVALIRASWAPWINFALPTSLSLSLTFSSSSLIYLFFLHILQIVSPPLWNAVVLIRGSWGAPWINFTAFTHLTPAFTQRVSKVSQMFNVQLPSISWEGFLTGALLSYNFAPNSYAWLIQNFAGKYLSWITVCFHVWGLYLISSSLCILLPYSELCWEYETLTLKVLHGNCF